MRGTNAIDGSALSGIEHLRQSIADILRTPIGTRVLRREYGSRLFSLVDAPLNRETTVEIIAAVAEALSIWEPRIKVSKVKVAQLTPGKIMLDIQGRYLPDGVDVTLEGIAL